MEIVLYTMLSCPFCKELKDKLDANNIDYIECDIDQYAEEYEMFKEAVGNPYVPGFMIVEDKDNAELYAPDRDFQTIDEAIGIIIKQLGF